jgi:mono/diheme cytochrome c family protein
VFDWIAEGGRRSWQRSALLRGAEVALLNAAMPGSPVARGVPRSGSALPCPTCPGGRAGPGGAYAYSKPEDFVVASGRVSGRSGARVLRLNREPQELLGIAARGGDLSVRIVNVLAKVVWPGKPGETPVVPLTPEEQRRFAIGREVYTNLCQACHQPDGRGQDRIAPSLVDSSLLLADPEIPARILLNGKEGSVGLMPPMGSTLSDEQVASVLTYVRREWGHTGTAVEPAAIAGVRALTRERTRPWMHDELVKLAAEKRE